MEGYVQRRRTKVRAGGVADGLDGCGTGYHGHLGWRGECVREREREGERERGRERERESEKEI